MLSKEELLEHKAKAQNYAYKENSAYIHTEMMDGKSPQTILCGDIIGMLYCIEAELNRIGELTHTSFESAVEIMMINHKIGFSNVKEFTKDFDKKEIKGSFDELKEDIEKEYKRKAEKDESNLAELRKKLRDCKTDYGTLKAKLEKSEKEAFSREQKLQKQIMRLEHENDSLREKLMFRGAMEDDGK